VHGVELAVVTAADDALVIRMDDGRSHHGRGDRDRRLHVRY
jgi:hypothetical protein